MARKGPVTKNAEKVPLGLAQIRVGSSASNVATTIPVLAATDSIGAMASTKFVGSIEYWKLESGFPLLEDYVVPLRAAAALECAFKEVKPWTMNLAIGLATLSGEVAVHSGEVPLGQLASPEYIRMEANYVYPDDTNEMNIIFPRAQVTSSIEIDLQEEDSPAVPIVFESKRADSEISGGNAVWDSKPLGAVLFRPKP